MQTLKCFTHSTSFLTKVPATKQARPANQAVLESQCSHWIRWISLALRLEVLTQLLAWCTAAHTALSGCSLSQEGVARDLLTYCLEKLERLFLTARSRIDKGGDANSTVSCSAQQAGL